MPRIHVPEVKGMKFSAIHTMPEVLGALRGIGRTQRKSSHSDVTAYECHIPGDFRKPGHTKTSPLECHLCKRRTVMP